MHNSDGAVTTDIPPGHELVKSEDLEGQALAWAACAVYQIPAAIFEGVVHVESEPGKWTPFDAEELIRSLILGHVPNVLVPHEIISNAQSSDPMLKRCATTS